ncbi:hypothetical protein [Nocardia sp. NPDC052112]
MIIDPLIIGTARVVERFDHEEYVSRLETLRGHLAVVPAPAV